MSKTKICKDGFIYFPPKGECVPLKGSIYTPAVQKEVGAVVLGSLAMGGFLGWVFRGSEEDREDEERYVQELIAEHQLDGFISNIASLEIEMIDEQQLLDLIDQMGDNVVLRWSEVESDEDSQILLEDLDALQKFLEFSALNQGELENVRPLLNKIHEFKDAVEEANSDE